MSSNYTSNERLYLNSKDEVVKKGDADAQKLLVGQGGEIPMETAKKYGLVKEEGAPTRPEPITSAESAAAIETADAVVDVPKAKTTKASPKRAKK